MATDYDAPRKTDEDASEESIEELKTRRHDKNSGKVDEDEAEAGARVGGLNGAPVSPEMSIAATPALFEPFHALLAAADPLRA